MSTFVRERTLNATLQGIALALFAMGVLLLSYQA